MDLAADRQSQLSTLAATRDTAVSYGANRIEPELPRCFAWSSAAVTSDSLYVFSISVRRVPRAAWDSSSASMLHCSCVDARWTHREIQKPTTRISLKINRLFGRRSG